MTHASRHAWLVATARARCCDLSRYLRAGVLPLALLAELADCCACVAASDCGGGET